MEEFQATEEAYDPSESASQNKIILYTSLSFPVDNFCLPGSGSHAYLSLNLNTGTKYNRVSLTEFASMFLLKTNEHMQNRHPYT
jgi:hypothetical protein